MDAQTAPGPSDEGTGPIALHPATVGADPEARAGVLSSRPEEVEGDEAGDILVGVDGSVSSMHALRWAVREARLRRRRLRILSAWWFPHAQGGIADLARESVRELLEAEAEGLLESAVAQIGGEAEGVEIERCVAEGPAASALLRCARDAELLVVGSRGRGGFASLALGSVSQQCALHAPCPVVIVRDVSAD